VGVGVVTLGPRKPMVLPTPAIIDPCLSVSPIMMVQTLVQSSNSRNEKIGSDDTITCMSPELAFYRCSTQNKDEEDNKMMERMKTTTYIP
jgi:hypothetical protein